MKSNRTKPGPITFRRRKFDAFPDRIDLRDWSYRPTLAPLPEQLINCHAVPEILDQRTEGACTGFALAAVINFMLHRRGIRRRVSPRMLYELARCYDEWPGEDYEGSSARGAIKGWIRHGVCLRTTWPDDRQGRQNFNDVIANESQATPCGAYYRVAHRNIRDMHAALNETGILYTTLMVHAGWDKPGPKTVKILSNNKQIVLPVIQRKGRAENGHAVSLVGYTSQGFIIQNSWGKQWGRNGFALLPYEDYLLHSTDVWVTQLGVPVLADLWRQENQTDCISGLHRANAVIPLKDIRPYVVNIGNHGKLSSSGEYWTSEVDLERLFSSTIPETTTTWKKRRVMLFVHGGLNAERDAAKRIVAMRDVCLANEIYPLHIMWETGPLETLSSILEDTFSKADERAGGGFLEGMREAKDKVLELTMALVGGSMWREMKENARQSSEHHRQLGGVQLMAKHAALALTNADKTQWELHVVGHSAGSIFIAHALPHFHALGLPFSSLQLMAPAIRTDVFKQLVIPEIESGRCPLPTTYLLSSQQELNDSVGPYGRSLLWLVSRAFEGKRDTPLLGMHDCVQSDKTITQLFRRKIRDLGLPALVISGASTKPGMHCNSNTHGGFDNDVNTMNSVLYRILMGAPKRPFTARDLAYD